MPAPDSSQLTGLILAGGKARRMDGQDKGLLPYRGRLLIAHVIERLEPQVSALLVNANRHSDQYAQFGHPVVADASDDFLGPLAGILAGLRAARTKWLLCVPCDSPRIGTDLAVRLAAPLDQKESRICAAVCAERLQPVFALMECGLAEALEEFLEQGGRKIDEFYKMHDFTEVHFEDPDEFFNINTPEALDSNGH